MVPRHREKEDTGDSRPVSPSVLPSLGAEGEGQEEGPGACMLMTLYRKEIRGVGRKRSPLQKFLLFLGF